MKNVTIFPCGASDEINFQKTLVLAEITKQAHALFKQLPYFLIFELL